MHVGRRLILVLNCGSSSLKYAGFDGEAVVLRGEIERIGAGGVSDHAAAVASVIDELTRRGLGVPRAVGHRLVHGGPAHVEPTPVDDELLAALQEAIPFAPLHLPAELRAIAAVRESFGDLLQVACFDTAFHRTMPEVARRLPLPASLNDRGIRRYGFHGLSYEYIASVLEPAQQRRAVFAHLGNGASMVAVRAGRAVDTTMGFTPAGGLVMGTRPGDLDPGLVVYLLNHGYDAASLDRLFEHEAGLLALSATSSDVKQLLGRRAADPRAAFAIEVFCYHARKTIGAYAAVLGGLDTLVFTGGIGEHAAEIRSEICDGLDFLGIELDDRRNHAGERSVERGACAVFVIATDEERVIARATQRLLERAR